MAQRSKFIGAPSRNEFWEPQEGRQQRVADEKRLCESSEVAVKWQKAVLNRDVGKRVPEKQGAEIEKSP